MNDDKHTPSMGPLTLEDVRVAVQEIADSDSSKTNASAIRKHLKRGSNSTIQKLLDGLRTARQSEITKELHTDLPEMPLAEMQALWITAALAAKQNSYARLVVLQQERDAAHIKVSALETDLQNANEEIDLLVGQVGKLTNEVTQSATQCIEKENQAQLELQKQNDKNAELLSAFESQVTVLEKTIVDIRHAGEIEQLKFTAEKSALERVINQQSEHQARLQKLLDQLQPVKSN